MPQDDIRDDERRDDHEEVAYEAPRVESVKLTPEAAEALT